MKKSDIKIVVLSVFGLLLVVGVTIGVTYSYFNVGISNNTTASTVNAQMPAESFVTLSGGNKTIAMNITAAQMMKGTADITYYAPNEGNVATTEETNIEIGKAITSDDNTYSCTYNIGVTPKAVGISDAFKIMENKSTDQIVLKIGENILDFNDQEFLLDKEITMTGNLIVTNSGTPINVQLKFVNKVNVDQTSLKDLSQSFDINIKSLSCVITNP